MGKENKLKSFAFIEWSSAETLLQILKPQLQQLNNLLLGMMQYFLDLEILTAPIVDSFSYHWKHFKNIYVSLKRTLSKCRTFSREVTVWANLYSHLAIQMCWVSF